MLTSPLIIAYPSSSRLLRNVTSFATDSVSPTSNAESAYTSFNTLIVPKMCVLLDRYAVFSIVSVPCICALSWRDIVP